VYRTVNKVNNKIYIGKHQTKVIEDSYLGSGKLLKRAIEKYGRKSFEKEILFVFDNETDMNAKEAELVDESFCLREDTYNVCFGGKGGWGLYNSNSEVQRNKAKKSNIKQKLLAVDDPDWVKSKAEKISNSNKKQYASGERTSSFKHLNAILNKGKLKGYICINNGVVNKKCKPENIPDGFVRGRLSNKVLIPS
jgi:hypothetical protein